MLDRLLDDFCRNGRHPRSNKGLSDLKDPAHLAQCGREMAGKSGSVGALIAGMHLGVPMG
jgi:hypothetical protein